MRAPGRFGILGGMTMNRNRLMLGIGVALLVGVLATVWYGGLPAGFTEWLVLLVPPAMLTWWWFQPVRRGWRKTAVLTGFLMPTVPAWAFVAYASNYFGDTSGLATWIFLMLYGIPSVVVGLILAAIGYAKSRPPPSKHETCANCGYSLRGLPSARCPECGQRSSANSASR